MPRRNTQRRDDEGSSEKKKLFPWLYLDDEEEEEEEEDPRVFKLETAKISYDLLRNQRAVLVSEPITSRLTERVSAQLLWLNAQSHDPIKLFINTPGGSADDGFAIFDIMRFIEAPVFSICVGLNASAGTIVLLGSSAERRLATPNARIMIHQPSGGARGRASDIEITAEEILKLRRRANELIAAECGRGIEEVEKDTDRDHWLTPQEAKEYGLISRIITSLKEIE